MITARAFKRAPLAAFLGLALATLPIAGAGQAGPSGWHVTESDRVELGHRIIEGDLIISRGSTLEIMGAIVEIAGRVVVEEGARLQLGPLNDRPTVLIPTIGNDAFWIDVHGELQVGGLPNTRIHGLAGDGIASAVTGVGGIQVHRIARLENLEVASGLGPVVVGETGNAAIRNATISNLGEVGLAVLGTAKVADSAVQAVDIGITGRETCDITAERIQINATVNNVMVNSCSFRITEGQLVGGQSSLVATGSAQGTISKTVIAGYSIEGIAANMHPGPDGALRKPVLVIDNSTLVPMISGETGISTHGGHITTRDVVIVRHAGNGISAREATLDIAETTLRLNGGYGIHAVAGNFESNPLTNDFGSVDAGQRNVEGDIAHTVAFYAAALDQDGNLVPGLSIDVQDGMGESVFMASSSQDYMQVSYQAYNLDSNGRASYRGPFQYVATHPDLDEPTTGVAPDRGTLKIDVLSRDTFPTGPLIGGLVVLVAGVGAVLLLSRNRRSSHSEHSKRA